MTKPKQISNAKCQISNQCQMTKCQIKTNGKEFSFDICYLDFDIK